MNGLRVGLPRLKAPTVALRPWTSRFTLRPSQLPALSSPPTLLRPLSTTPANLKKHKPTKQSAPAPTQATTSSHDGEDAGPAANPEDPHNFSDVTARFGHLSTRFQAELKQARQGGALNPASLSALSVPTREGAFPLRELAQVVPRANRTVSLLVNDAAHVKPVMSAIQASPAFNQQPQRDPENELELVMKVEVERPEEIKKRLKEVCHLWRERVRGVRTKRDKVISAWKKDGTVTADVSKKLGTELTNLMKKELAAVDKAETQAVAQVEKLEYT
ncbi:uncharacterized protein DNG_04883 [Cephalotrichum gorgonifer]|uniref:Ribosome recycling factor domain-containing protein n=1 Tax=Cephalotrichum gorgonifer TaxID=2041049 RepID=A0AAE8MXG9_9PEZI|nr:uncharacterized protein DNG_04883 [Cephalotrichum gorgonifer]